MTKRRILITGGTGQVGTELLRCSWPEDVELVAPTRSELDLRDCETVERYVSSGNFAAVINSGAYTAVDRAESDVLTAWKVNALAPAALAAETNRKGIPLVHVSTDYVFDGAKDRPYLETDPIAPLGVYGASKEAGEQAVRTGNPKHIILRTAWVFGRSGNNFVKTMIRLSGEHRLLKVVNDQRGCPTAASDIAGVLATLTGQLMEGDTPLIGTYNFVNSGAATWYQFACEIFRQLNECGRTVPVVEPISSDQYPTPARRPSNSQLSTEKIQRALQTEPRDWRVALSQVLESLAP